MRLGDRTDSRKTKEEQRKLKDRPILTGERLQLTPFRYSAYTAPVVQKIDSRETEIEKKDFAETNGNAMKAQSKGTV